MCSPYVNALPAPLKLLSPCYLQAGLLYFHSGILQCIINVFLGAFICIHMHTKAQALLLLIFLHLLSPRFCSAEERLCKLQTARLSLEKRGHNRVLFSQGGKKVRICLTKYQPILL